MVFADYAALTAYSAEPWAYAGQVCTILSPPKAYIIASDFSLVEISATNSGYFNREHNWMFGPDHGETLYVMDAVLGHTFAAGLADLTFAVATPPADGDATIHFWVDSVEKASITFARYTGVVTISSASDIVVTPGQTEAWTYTMSTSAADSALFGISVNMLGVRS